MAKKLRYSVYLAKPEVKDFLECLSDNPDKLQLTEAIKRDDAEHVEHVFYSKVTGTGTPQWFGLFSRKFDLPSVGGTRLYGLYFRKVQERIFCIAFGYAASCLNDSKFVSDFGIKTALNKVTEGELRTIDSLNLSNKALQNRRQKGYPDGPLGFGVDPVFEMLRAISGKDSADASETVSGSRQSYKPTTELNFDNIDEKLLGYLESYNSESYKEKFPYFDNIQPVFDKSIISKLDEELMKNLISEGESDPRLFLAPPEIVDESTEEGIQKYSFTGMGRIDPEPTMSIRVLREHLQENPDSNSIEWLNKNRIKTYHSDGESKYKTRWPIYNCIVFEVALSAVDLYVLAEGQWFSVKKEFHETIQENYRAHAIERCLPDAQIISGKIELERDYIERICRANPALILMDQKPVKATGLGGNFEFCDILSVTKNVFHLKRGNAAASLSHLFVQGMNYTQLFYMDELFRKNARAHLTGTQQDLIPLQQPDPKQYAIVFGIIMKPKTDGSTELSFLNKISFKNAYDRITALGFAAKLCIIRAV